LNYFSSLFLTQQQQKRIIIIKKQTKLKTKTEGMAHPILDSNIHPIDDNRHQLVTSRTSENLDGRLPNTRELPIRRKSVNIPLPESHVHRTRSEVQLCEDMESAEQRDLNMFHRLVNGIRDRQMDLVQENKSSNAAAAFYDPAHALTEAEQSLSHIIHTRNAPVSGTTAGNNSNCNNNNNNASRIIPFSKNNYKNNNNINCHNQQQQHFLDNNGEGLATAALNTGLDGNHNNEWSVSGFDDCLSSLNLESEFQQQQQHHYHHPQQQQQFSSNHQTAATASSSLAHNFTTAATDAVATTDSYTTPNALQQYRYLSSNSMTEGTVEDEGIFDFDL